MFLKKCIIAAAVMVFASHLSHAAQTSGNTDAEGSNGGARVELKPDMPKMSGYIEGWFRSDGSDLSDQTIAAKKVGSEFRIRRARLNALGNVTPDLSYKIGASLDGPSPASATAAVRLWDAYMTYKFSRYAAVTFGQTKYDFTLEGTEATPDRLAVLRSEAVNDIAGKLGTRGGGFRDIGVRLKGSFSDALGFAYGIGLYNGSGMNTGDNNSNKDVAGRLSFSVLDNLKLGFSGYVGKAQDAGANYSVKESAYGADAQYSNDAISLRAEYLAGRWSNWDVLANAASSNKTQRPQGWYAQASYMIPQIALEALLRYEDYRKDAKTPLSGLETTTLGATYHISGRTRLSANYLIRTAQDSPVVTAQETEAKGAKIKNLFLLQALLAF